MKGSIQKVERKTKGTGWRVRVEVPSDRDQRKWKSRTFDTKKEAEEWQTRINHELNEDEYVEPSKQSLEDFLERWLEDYAELNVRESTYDRYHSDIYRHIVPEIGGIRISNLEAAHLQTFYRNKLDHGRLNDQDGLSPTTVRHFHTILHKALNCAVKWGVLKSNPAASADPPKRDDPEYETLTVDQTTAFLEIAEEHAKDGPIYHLLALMGLRRSEALGLSWDHVDLEKPTLTIQRTLVQTPEGNIVFGEPKSHRSKRDLPIPELATKALKRHRQEQNKQRMKCGPGWDDENNLVFTKPNGEPITPRNLNRRFKRLLERGDFPDISLHELRHTCGTLLAEQGEHPKVVQSILGHKDISTTMDIYSHVSDDWKEEATQALEDRISMNQQKRSQS